MIETPEGLAAFLASKLEQDRRYAEALMLDTCVVEFKTGRSVQNEETGREEAIYEARFISRCKVQDKGLTDRDRTVGGRREVASNLQVHLPWNAPTVHVDDRIRITAIGAASKPDLLDRTYIVGASASKSMATATRLNVTEES